MSLGALIKDELEDPTLHHREGKKKSKSSHEVIPNLVVGRNVRGVV